jgi:Arc/MetJ-type ribon-helix-helix transcriptional regulator
MGNSEAQIRAQREFRRRNWDFTLTVTQEQFDRIDELARKGHYKDGKILREYSNKAEVIRSAIQLKLDVDNGKVNIW